MFLKITRKTSPTQLFPSEYCETFKNKLKFEFSSNYSIFRNSVFTKICPINRSFNCFGQTKIALIYTTLNIKINTIFSQVKTLRGICNTKSFGSAIIFYFFSFSAANLDGLEKVASVFFFYFFALGAFDQYGNF